VVNVSAPAQNKFNIAETVRFTFRSMGIQEHNDEILVVTGTMEFYDWLSHILSYMEWLIMVNKC